MTYRKAKRDEIIVEICAECNNEIKISRRAKENNINKNGRLICRTCKLSKKDKTTNKIIEICTECNSKTEISCRAKKKNINKNGRFICRTCNLELLWKNPNYREKQISRLKATQGAITKKLWENEEFRNKIIAGNIDNNKNPARIEQRSRTTKELWTRKDFRDKITTSSTKLWKNDGFRNKVMLGARSIISKLHKILIAMLEDFEIEYENEKVLGPWAFDVYLPQFQTLIEIQGDYWHSRSDRINADNQKATYFEKYLSNKYKLKYVWEHEFYQEGRLCSFISECIGEIVEFKAVDFKFDDVVVKQIKKEHAVAFLNKYHYLSYVRNGIHLGAFLSELLIGVVTYSNPIRKESATSEGYKHNEVLELSRFCIKLGYNKKNFSSWLISKSVKLISSIKPNTGLLFTFADSTFGHKGIIYKAANWKLSKTVAPDYYYVNEENGWSMHKKTLYNRARNLSMTEKQFAKEKGFTKLKTCEKYKYVYHI